MRHQKRGRRLGRTASHRKAMYSNMVAALVTHERIETTESKAKELRRIAERTITWAVSLGDVLAKEPDERSPEEVAQYVHHVRMARRVLKDREALNRLFTEVAPRFVERHGGYLRIVKTRLRRGDAAPLAFIEFVDYEPAVSEKADKESAKAAE
ncbi:50S ribosomal protein L17 [Myxococcota bacterium]